MLLLLPLSTELMPAKPSHVPHHTPVVPLLPALRTSTAAAPGGEPTAGLAAAVKARQQAS
jgi:hypothetical protein